MSQDNRPASIQHRQFDSNLAHSRVRFDNSWMITTCGIALALPEGSPVTCMTCLVKAAAK